jgi:hypothetical protein
MTKPRELNLQSRQGTRFDSNNGRNCNAVRIHDVDLGSIPVAIIIQVLKANFRGTAVRNFKMANESRIRERTRQIPCDLHSTIRRIWNKSGSPQHSEPSWRKVRRFWVVPTFICDFLLLSLKCDEDMLAAGHGCEFGGPLLAMRRNAQFSSVPSEFINPKVLIAFFLHPQSA